MRGWSWVEVIGWDELGGWKCCGMLEELEDLMEGLSVEWEREEIDGGEG